MKSKKANELIKENLNDSKKIIDNLILLCDDNVFTIEN